MILVCGALDVELRACMGDLTGESETLGDLRVFRTEDALFCQTGPGRRAETVVEAVLQRHWPEAIISAGTAGALAPRLAPGDLVLCEQVGRAPETRCNGDRRLLQAAVDAARRASLPVNPGTAVTVDSVAGTVERGQTLREQGYDVAEMESYWVAAVAARSGIPFLAVRAVSDTTDAAWDEIPGLYDERGNVDPMRLIEFGRQHPDLAPALAARAMDGQKAIESLRKFVPEFLATLARPAKSMA